MANLRISLDDFTKLKDLKALYQQMKDCVKDKVYLKSLEKFGQKIEAYIEAYLEQNPNQEEAKEPPAGYTIYKWIFRCPTSLLQLWESLLLDLFALNSS